MNADLQQAAERIRAEYDRREREVEPDFYALYHPANLFIRHDQERAILWGLRAAGVLPLADRTILEVGCGTGQWLGVYENFGARRENLAGIDLDAGRAATCAARYPGADIRTGDASRLPWPDGHFDVVWQSTVFTSILECQMQLAVAGEMLRVLKPGGAILWYDFQFNNPRNPNVRGIGRHEIQSLFPSCRIRTRRTTLAPPLARRVAPLSRSLAQLLTSLRLLNTHLLGVIQRNG